MQRFWDRLRNSQGEHRVAANNELDAIRIRLEPKLRARWKKTIQGRKINQQDAITAMIEWICEQDALTQAMIFGQVPDTDFAELARVVLSRLQSKS